MILSPFLYSLDENKNKTRKHFFLNQKEKIQIRLMCSVHFDRRLPFYFHLFIRSKRMSKERALSLSLSLFCRIYK